MGIGNQTQVLGKSNKCFFFFFFNLCAVSIAPHSTASKKEKFRREKGLWAWMVAYVCNISTWELEAGGLGIHIQPGLNELLFQRNKRENEEEH